MYTITKHCVVDKPTQKPLGSYLFSYIFLNLIEFKHTFTNKGKLKKKKITTFKHMYISYNPADQPFLYQTDLLLKLQY